MSGSKTRETIKSERVYTHSFSEDFHYSTIDLSGEFRLDSNGAKRNFKKAFVQLWLDWSFEYYQGAKKEIKEDKRRFIDKHNKDTHYDFKKILYLPGIEKFKLIWITDYTPCMFGKYWYILHMFLTTIELYKIYVNCYC